jgi:hypothetical protein
MHVSLLERSGCPGAARGCRLYHFFPVPALTWRPCALAEPHMAQVLAAAEINRQQPWLPEQKIDVLAEQRVLCPAAGPPPSLCCKHACHTS